MNTKTTMKLPLLSMITFVGMVLCLTAFLSAQETTIETCADCHEDIAAAFMSKPHAATNSCTGCHGDAEEHLSEGGGPNIFAFSAEDVPNAKSKMCLSCHSKTNGRYMASPHGKASLDCTTCHAVHAENTYPSMLMTSPSKNCSVCHADVFSKFQLNERHRLQEGIMSCTTCHDPHQPSTRERLGGFKHQACLQCHTDKGGPFLYEHGASIIEGCSSCHEVHGSPNRHMLTHQSVTNLCYSCHTFVASFHTRFTTDTNCSVCHSTVHGSNLSKIFLK